MRGLFDIRIVRIKKVEQEDLCPLDDFCGYDFSNFRDVVNCEKFRKLVLLQKEGKWVIGK